MPKTDTKTDTPVLIVGAGPIGLALAGDLGWRGVPCTLIEKTEGRVDHPKMDLIGVRTMEFCRRWGIADRVRDAPYPPDYPQDYVWLESFTGYEFGREKFPGRGFEPCRRRARRSASACRRTCSTPSSRSGRPSSRASRFTTTPSWSASRIRARMSPPPCATRRPAQTREITADYMVGTDGGASFVRETLGIQMSGHPALTYTTNVIFRCPDLPSLHDKGRGYRFIFIGPEGTWLTIVAINGGDRFRMSIVGSPEKVTHSEADIRAALLRAMGKPFDYEILSVLRWVRRELVAESYGRGRVYLAGDSVHLTSPTGALGMNTGMQDAVDLGWKLDAVLNGWGGENLLATYEIERKPVAIRNIKASTDNLERMLAPRTTHKPTAGDVPAGTGGRRRAQEIRRVVHRADAARVVHERLPPRLSLRQFADRVAGRHAGAAARRPDLHPDGAAGCARAACLDRRGALDARSLSARVLCCSGSAPMRRRATASSAPSPRPACRCASRRSTRRTSENSMSGRWCWCGRTAMWPGAPTRNPPMPPRSPIACAGRDV